MVAGLSMPQRAVATGKVVMGVFLCCREICPLGAHVLLHGAHMHARLHERFMVEHAHAAMLDQKTNDLMSCCVYIGPV